MAPSGRQERPGVGAGGPGTLPPRRRTRTAARGGGRDRARVRRRGRLALAAYNAGEAAVRAHGGVPPYAETREYVRRVRSLYDGAGRVMPGAVALITTPQRIYRAVADDGTLTFTNLPPRTATPAGPF